MKMNAIKFSSFAKIYSRNNLKNILGIRTILGYFSFLYIEKKYLSL
jgi:hypothetical protein